MKLTVWLFCVQEFMHIAHLSVDYHFLKFHLSSILWLVIVNDETCIQNSKTLSGTGLVNSLVKYKAEVKRNKILLGTTFTTVRRNYY